MLDRHRRTAMQNMTRRSLLAFLAMVFSKRNRFIEDYKQPRYEGGPGTDTNTLAESTEYAVRI